MIRLSAAALAALLFIAAPTQAQFQPCENGQAGEYECLNVDLLAHVDLETFGSPAGNDSWGWTDPLTGREYAIMGLADGTAFVDITDPIEAVFLVKIPTHTEPTVWRDVKVYGDFAFIVSEADGHGMQVFDMGRLRDISPGEAPLILEPDAHYDMVGHSHNVVINPETGLGVIVGNREEHGCNGGLHMVDLRDPLDPVFVGCFAEDGYTHDAQCVIYRGPDARYHDHEICFAANENTVTIVDVSDRANPVMLSQALYPNTAYTHQGWLTEDQDYLIVNDELDEMRYDFNTRTLIFDVRDLEAPTFVGPHFHDVPAIDHNLYVRGEAVYFANYRSGLRVALIDDLSEASLTNIGFFDSHPEDTEAQFGGAWSNYPFFASGSVVLSDMNRGLFILRPHHPDPLEVTNLHAFTATGGALIQWRADPTGMDRFVIELQGEDRPQDLATTRVGPDRVFHRRYVELPGGEHTIRIRAVDASGLTRYSEAFTVTVGN